MQMAASYGNCHFLGRTVFRVGRRPTFLRDASDTYLEHSPAAHQTFHCTIGATYRFPLELSYIKTVTSLPPQSHFLFGLHSIHTSSVILPAISLLPASKSVCSQNTHWRWGGGRPVSFSTIYHITKTVHSTSTIETGAWYT